MPLGNHRKRANGHTLLKRRILTTVFLAHKRFSWVSLPKKPILPGLTRKAGVSCPGTRILCPLASYFSWSMGEHQERHAKRDKSVNGLTKY